MTRKKKRKINYITRKLSKQRFFVDCNYHPCVVTRVYKSYEDLYGSDVDGVSLVTGNGSSCSILHCSPFPLTKNEAIERAQYYRDNGVREYWKKYLGATDASLDEYNEYYKDYNFFGRDVISKKSVVQIINENLSSKHL